MEDRKNQEPIIGPNRLTRFEVARIIGARALQLSLGAPPLIDPYELPMRIRIDPVLLAKEEFKRGVLPISVVRYTRKGLKQIIPIQVLLENTLRFIR